MDRLVQYKLIFFVPIADAETVKESIFQTGAGQLGQYQRCSWQCKGVGQFLPGINAKPTIGNQLTLSTVEEFRVEILCDEQTIVPAIQALKASHPYEEPAFEVIKLEAFNDC